MAVMSKSSTVSQKLIGLFVPYLPVALAEAQAIQAKTGLSVGQCRVLVAVSVGVNRVGMLAEIQGVSQPAMSKTVDTLVKDAFLERVYGLTDRRQIDLRLTTKSRTVIAKIKSSTLSRLARRLDELSGADLKRLEEGVEVLLSLLQSKKGQGS